MTGRCFNWMQPGQPQIDTAISFLTDLQSSPTMNQTGCIMVLASVFKKKSAGMLPKN